MPPRRRKHRWHDEGARHARHAALSESKTIASLPYLVALIGFMTLTLAAYLWLGWRVIGNSDGKLCLLASGAVWINLMHGQNGFLTAVLAASAMLMLERRPVLAGACIGLLAIKSHLAVFFPQALLAAGAWIARDGMQHGWLPAERELLLLAWLLPALSLLITLQAPVQLAPLVLGALMPCCWRRLRARPGA